MYDDPANYTSFSYLSTLQDNGVYNKGSTTEARDCNTGIPDTEIPDRFSIPKSRDYERPNPGISRLENNVLTLLLRVKCMH